MISATLDSNVYIQALHFRSRAALLIRHAQQRKIRIDISEAIVKETMRVLHEKFQWDGYMLNDVRNHLESIANKVIPSETLRVIKEDPDDDRILRMRR